MAVPVVSQPNDIPDYVRTSVVTIGKFDGVHLGHQQLLENTRSLAARLQKKTLAVTFDPPPVQILNPDLPIRPPITPVDRKISLLRSFGIDEVIVLQTGRWLLDLSAKAFFDEIIVSGFQASGMVEGPNFTFGKNRSGGTKELSSWCKEKSLEFMEVNPVEIDGQWVTSSRICKCIHDGELGRVNQLLGHRFMTRGTVVRGAGRGRSIQVPTANLESCDTIIPGPGVYAARARFINSNGRRDEKFYPAAVNVGKQPTFESEIQRLEVHLVNHEDHDFYGEQLELIWLDRIRETRKFNSIEELKGQIDQDIRQVKVINQKHLVMNPVLEGKF